MDVEELSERLSVLKRATTPFQFAVVAKAEDGKPELLLAKLASGFDERVRKAREGAKDKRMCTGRVVNTDGGLLFGVADGNLPVASASKAIRDVLSKHTGLKTHRSLLATACFIDAESSPLLRSKRPSGAEDEDVLITSTREAVAKRAGKVSTSREKKSSVYSQILEGLASWQARFNGGRGLTYREGDAAATELEALGERIDQWHTEHKEKKLELGSTKKRREELRRLKDELTEARTLLRSRLLPTIGLLGDWDKLVGTVTPDNLVQARRVVEGLRGNIGRLAEAVGEESPRVLAARAKLVEFEQAIERAVGGADIAFTEAWNGWREVHGDAIDTDRLTDAADRVDALEQAAIAARAYGLHTADSETALQRVRDARRLIRWNRERAKIELGFDRAWQTFRETFAEGVVVETPKHLEVMDDLLASVRQLAALPDVFPRPHDLVDAVKALQDARTSRERGGAQDVFDAAKDLLESFPHGVDSVDQLSEARALCARLETMLAKLGTKRSKFAQRVTDHLERVQSSIVRVQQQHDVTDEELQRLGEVDVQVSERDLRREQGESQVWRDQVERSWAKGRYEVSRNLGRGANGTVDLLESLFPGEPPIVMKRMEDTAELEHEANVYAQLGPHPNIARCGGIVTHEGEKVLLLEAIDGGDLVNAFTKGRDATSAGRLSHQEYWGAVQHLVRGTVRALAWMEKKGLGHTDVKADNVMIDKQTGEATLIDFGSARETGAAPGDGTAGYMPAFEEPTGHKRDVFAVGGIVHAAGTGETFNYGGENSRVATIRRYFSQDIAPLQKLGEGEAPGGGKYGAHTQYVAFMEALLHRDPEQRLSFEQALTHPFLMDALMSEDEARVAVKKLAGL